MFTLNTLRVLPESLERKYFSVYIAIFYKFAFYSYKFRFKKNRHGIFLVEEPGFKNVKNKHLGMSPF